MADIIGLTYLAPEVSSQALNDNGAGDKLFGAPRQILRTQRFWRNREAMKRRRNSLIQ